MIFSGRERYVSYRWRLRMIPKPGTRGWLVPDRGTERDLVVTAEPFAAVRAAIGSLEDDIVIVPAVTARKVCQKLGVYEASEPDPAVDRAAAFAAISRSIADEMVEDYHTSVEYFGGRSLSRYLAATVGRGRALLFQKIDANGAWKQQRCFLVDASCAVHTRLRSTTLTPVNVRVAPE